ncbi:MAG: PelD GGDEF domain-containing protein [Acidihalobacter sp.]
MSERDSFSQLQRPKAYWSLLETVLITAALPIFGLWLRPDDPFFLHADFPWLVLAPLLPALRYGFVYGFGSALSLATLIALGWRLHWFPMPYFPGSFVLGLLVVGMVAGEFSDLWARREAREHTVANYQRQRLDEFTRAYHMLRVSHDRLEQRLAASSQSLRLSLVQVRRLLFATPADQSMLEGAAEAIMGLFADFGWVQVAELYALHEGQPDAEPLARLGQSDALRADDPLVREALHSGELVSVRSEDLASLPRDTNGVLVAVPFVDVNGEIWALLTIHEMPFVAFQQQNLMLLAVLGGYIADQFVAAKGRAGIADSTSSDFVRDAERALIQRRRFGLPSMVQTVAIDNAAQEDNLIGILSGQVRGLDRLWIQHSAAQTPVLFMLMPLTNEAQGVSYRTRIGRQLREVYGVEADVLGVTFQGREIDPRDSVDGLIDYLCEVGGVDRVGIAYRSRSGV